MSLEVKGTVRCAIYTRKSSEEGLEQSFNSLDAQREACESFVNSQRHEGWKTLPSRYDDGGYSGGTMERPALKQLLQDVAAGKINVIVVYKVDRLTRSLADFAKIVEALDATRVSFVSVTHTAKHEAVEQTVVREAHSEVTVGGVSSCLCAGTESRRVPVVALEAARVAELLPDDVWAAEPPRSPGTASDAQAIYSGNRLLAASSTVPVVIL